MNRNTLVLGAAVVVAACAHHPVFMDAEVEYPHLASRTCDRTGALAAVDVIVHDAEGLAIPGAMAYLLPMQNAATSPAEKTPFGVTDSAGHVTLEGTGGRPYAVTVVLAGFLPTNRVVLLDAGCRGSLTVGLTVALKYQ